MSVPTSSVEFEANWLQVKMAGGSSSSWKAAAPGRMIRTCRHFEYTTCRSAAATPLLRPLRPEAASGALTSAPPPHPAPPPLPAAAPAL